VLDRDELQQVASCFGVDEAQVLRDHLISHLLAALSTEAADSGILLGLGSAAVCGRRCSDMGVELGRRARAW
jgi:hypothetical protein